MDKKIDSLIKEAISQEINSVDVDDKTIEEEWEKFKIIKKKREKSNRLKRLLPIAAVIVLGVLITLPLLTSESYSWNIFKLFNITSDDDKTSIQQKSSGNNIKAQSNPDIEEMIVPIDKAKDIVDFTIMQLPFDLVETKLIDNSEVHLIYKAPEGEILFIQKQIGLENTQTINVSKSSKVEKFNMHGTEYTYINIKDKIIKVIWEITGMQYEMNFRYPITVEKSKDIINKLE